MNTAVITPKASSFLQFQSQLHKPISSFSPSFFNPIKSSSSPIIATLSVASSNLGLSETFSKLKKEGKVALMTCITAGDPDLSTTAEALKVLDSNGSNIIQLGVPYSDPLADNPVTQAAAIRALERGTNLDAILNMLKEVVPQLLCPVSLFAHHNQILKCGVEQFMKAVEEVGVHALVVPDVPLEETEILRGEASKHKIQLVLLTTPTTPKERMRAIVEVTEGALYAVSSEGVMWPRASVDGEVQSILQEIKEKLSKAVVVGVGISAPEHVKQVVGRGANVVIVGSAMVRKLGDAKSPEEGLKELAEFTKSLKSALL